MPIWFEAMNMTVFPYVTRQRGGLTLYRSDSDTLLYAEAEGLVGSDT